MFSSAWSRLRAIFLVTWLLPWKRDREPAPATALVWWAWLSFLVGGCYMGTAGLSSFVPLAPPPQALLASLKVHRSEGAWRSIRPAANHPVPPLISLGAGKQSLSWGKRQRQREAGLGEDGEAKGRVPLPEMWSILPQRQA